MGTSDRIPKIRSITPSPLEYTVTKDKHGREYSFGKYQRNLVKEFLVKRDATPSPLNYTEKPKSKPKLTLFDFSSYLF